MNKWIVKLITNTPVYPHWLEFRRLADLRKQLVSMLHGEVIEVGAGDGTLKREALSTNSKISQYIATDYSGWDKAFEEGNNLSRSKGFIDQLHLRNKREKLDKVCSALDLPFSDGSFDWHISTEVLEHIPDVNQFFSEAARITRSGGGVVLTAPFIYRIHPDKASDFFRILPGGYAAIAELNGFIVEKVISNTGLGCSCTALINQKIIRDYFEAEAHSIKRAVILLIMPLAFILTNLIGLLDGKNPDSRFASRFLVVLRKR